MINMTLTVFTDERMGISVGKAEDAAGGTSLHHRLVQAVETFCEQVPSWRPDRKDWKQTSQGADGFVVVYLVPTEV